MDASSNNARGLVGLQKRTVTAGLGGLMSFVPASSQGLSVSDILAQTSAKRETKQINNDN